MGKKNEIFDDLNNTIERDRDLIDDDLSVEQQREGFLTRMMSKCRGKVYALVGGMLLFGAVEGCGVNPGYNERGGSDASISDVDKRKVDCEDGDTRYCYEGKRSEINVGICREGMQTCKDGEWGVCYGEKLSAVEVCNSRDDDCDGQVDEVCPCEKGDIQECGDDVGECRKGVQTCIVQSGIAQWSDCKGEVSPQREKCDGRDNDCDGVVDEGDLCSYNEDCIEGVCRTSSSKNEKKIEIKTEIGVDRVEMSYEENVGEEFFEELPENDGGEGSEGENNSVDVMKLHDMRFEMKTKPEIVFDFAAESGKETVVEQKNESKRELKAELKPEQVPEPRVESRPELFSEPKVEKRPELIVDKCVPSVEICNGRDDNCNGQVDEGMTSVTCYTGAIGTVNVGLCKSGTKRCFFGRWTGCIGEVKPDSEVCDGQDNDCNGKVDDIAAQKCPYTGVPATTENIGECKSGMRTCKNGVWVACSGEITPSNEICNGKDDDCNGKIDDNLTQPDCTKQLGVCAGTKKTCGGAKGWIDCSTVDYLKHNASYEVSETLCDGKDNDCDGKIDSNDSLPKTATVCTVAGAMGECAKPGNWQCKNAKWVCAGVPNPDVETCNDKDDDCDGKTDEGACHFQVSVPYVSCYPNKVRKVCYYPFDASKNIIGAVECNTQFPQIQKTLPLNAVYVCYWVAVTCNQGSHSVDLRSIGDGLKSVKQLKWMRFVSCENRPYDANNPSASNMASRLSWSQPTKIDPALNTKSSYRVTVTNNITSCYHHAFCLELKKPIK